MLWNESNLMNERIKFVARLLDGESMTTVCREFGITVCKQPCWSSAIRLQNRNCLV
jgi:hypothetical protein